MKRLLLCGLTLAFSLSVVWADVTQKILPYSIPRTVTVIDDETGQAKTFAPNQLRVKQIRVGSDFNPAGGDLDPYIYVGSEFSRYNPDGSALFYVRTFTVPTTTPYPQALGDDAILNGPPNESATPFDPATPSACLSEFTSLIFNNAAAGTGTSNVTFTAQYWPWNGSFSGVAGPPVTIGTATFDTDPGDLILLSFAAANLPVARAGFYSLTCVYNTGPTAMTWVISLGEPGNTAYTAGKGGFRSNLLVNPTGSTVFTIAHAGSFFYALRGTHNFVAELDLSDLSAGDDCNFTIRNARPQDPIFAEFDLLTCDTNSDGNPDTGDGMQETMGRNRVLIEITNNTQTGTTRTLYESYMDENGRVTVGIAPFDSIFNTGVSSVAIYRPDNMLKARFDTTSGVTADPCNPGTFSAFAFFGDVTGSGQVDDADLAVVIFNFGATDQ